MAACSRDHFPVPLSFFKFEWNKTRYFEYYFLYLSNFIFLIHQTLFFLFIKYYFFNHQTLFPLLAHAIHVCCFVTRQSSGVRVEGATEGLESAPVPGRRLHQVLHQAEGLHQLHQQLQHHPCHRREVHGTKPSLPGFPETARKKARDENAHVSWFSAVLQLFVHSNRCII